jgi:hypothetical protein
MRMPSAAHTMIVAAGLFWAPVSAPAQSTTGAPPRPPLQTTIVGSGSQVVPSLIVMNARGAILQGGKLSLIGVSPSAILFADRPVRAAGHAVTAHLLRQWSPADASRDSFAKNPPNATVSAFSREGSVIRNAVVVLKAPKLEGDRLSFDVDVLEGDLAGADGPASVFIDNFGFSFRNTE